MNRLLTRRDKDRSHKRSRSSDPSKPETVKGILSLFKPETTKRSSSVKDDELARKVAVVRARLDAENIANVDDQQIEYALQTKYADGDPTKAFEITELFLESVEGHVRPYNADVYMKGAENRAAVTCYLDSLLFAMFARLDSFEPILYTTFDDEPKRRLATLLRLWVNMLRTGKLIQTDITKHIQEALAACGWREASRLEQQDTSEAFGFITETLGLPLLTLEMDIFHEGGLADKDDHKFVKERLLEVAVPSQSESGAPIRLEDCLEDHFNTRVEVVRKLARRDTLHRSNTRSSVQSDLSHFNEKHGLTSGSEEAEHSHVEIVEVPQTPFLGDEIVDSPGFTTTKTVSPPSLRHRAPSIIRHRIITEHETGDSSTSDGASIRGGLGMRKSSIRKEVLMPAWQFFRIIPWYTTNMPTNDTQVAAHFSSTRPVLGICLKRYAMDAKGKPSRQNTPIDIPLQIALPHFIQDDKSSDGGPLFGNFNLVLQSMVCHRGNSVHSGHYISIIRGGSQHRDQMPASDDASSDSPPVYAEDKWIKFDDFASERVCYVDIEKIMRDEMPYLLFYQVQPLFDDSAQCANGTFRPPPYEDSNTDSGIAMNVHETPLANGTTHPATVLNSVPNDSTESGDVATPTRSSYFESSTNAVAARESPQAQPRISFSDDIERPRKSFTLSDADSRAIRRGSTALTDASTISSMLSPSVPSTPVEEVPPTTKADSTAARISRAASRFTRSGKDKEREREKEKSKSRATSIVDESRASSISSAFSLTRLNLMRSKDTRSDVSIAGDAERIPSGGDVNITITNADTPLVGSRRTSIESADGGSTAQNAYVGNTVAERMGSALSTASVTSLPSTEKLERSPGTFMGVVGVGRSKTRKGKSGSGSSAGDEQERKRSTEREAQIEREGFGGVAYQPAHHGPGSHQHGHGHGHGHGHHSHHFSMSKGKGRERDKEKSEAVKAGEDGERECTVM